MNVYVDGIPNYEKYEDMNCGKDTHAARIRAIVNIANNNSSLGHQL